MYGVVRIMLERIKRYATNICDIPEATMRSAALVS
jgi:hypothetical protein